MNIRPLKADEIECRVGTFKEGKGLSLLLYKDARVDMNILDETFGIFGWSRQHELIGDRLYCTIFIWDESKCQWVHKQDVGTESNAEKEKGQASDSFKRAGFNVGIGRELYTAPFIWINETNKYTKFHVSEIGYNDNREINKLVIKDNKGKVRYTLGGQSKPSGNTGKITTGQTKSLEALLNKLDNSEDYFKQILSFNKVDKLEDLNTEQYGKAMQAIRKKLD